MPPRLRRLPLRRLPGGLVVHEAVGVRARLLGLALMRTPPGGRALWLRRTRSVHTVGMRFALDLVWLNGDGCPVRVDRGVRPGRIRSCRAARSVVEIPVVREPSKPPG